MCGFEEPKTVAWELASGPFAGNGFVVAFDGRALVLRPWPLPPHFLMYDDGYVAAGRSDAWKVAHWEDPS